MRAGRRVARENTGQSVKFEFLINGKSFLSASMTHATFGI